MRAVGPADGRCAFVSFVRKKSRPKKKEHPWFCVSACSHPKVNNKGKVIAQAYERAALENQNDELIEDLEAKVETLREVIARSIVIIMCRGVSGLGVRICSFAHASTLVAVTKLVSNSLI